MTSTNSGLREAPPTKKPSTSACVANSSEFLALTEPPYMMRVLCATSEDTFLLNQSLSCLWTSCACIHSTHWAIATCESSKSCACLPCCIGTTHMLLMLTNGSTGIPDEVTTDRSLQNFTPGKHSLNTALLQVKQLFTPARGSPSSTSKAVLSSRAYNRP